MGVYQRGDSQPAKAGFLRAADHARVYQRGDSQPAKANVPVTTPAPVSLSKRRFPTSQSSGDCVWSVSTESIKEAIPNQPKRNAAAVKVLGRVYQRGDSQPAKAAIGTTGAGFGSLSKRRFPTSQSLINNCYFHDNESIKEAIPNQPKRRTSS